MKRLLSFCLAVIMISSLCSTAFAVSISDEAYSEAETTVTYGVNDGYTIIIPESVQMDTNGLGNITISAQDVMLNSGYVLDVSVTGTSFSEYQWHLTDVNNNDNKLGYVITDSFSTISPNDVVLSVEAGEAYNSTVNAVLNLELSESCTLAGTYTDMLTFAIDVYWRLASLNGTYNLYVDDSVEAAIVLSDEDMQALDALAIEEEQLQYLHDKYAVKIQPSTIHDIPTWAYVSGTPNLRFPDDTSAFWVFAVEQEGVTTLEVATIYSFNGIFSFIADEKMPEESLKWLRQYGNKLSNSTAPMMEVYVPLIGWEWMQEGETWFEWQYSFYYDSSLTIQDGYVMLDDYYYLTLNDEYVKATDVIQGTYDYDFTDVAP